MSNAYEYFFGQVKSLFPDDGFTITVFLGTCVALSALSMCLAHCVQVFASFWDEITDSNDTVKLHNNPTKSVVLSWAINHCTSATIGAICLVYARYYGGMYEKDITQMSFADGAFTLDKC